MVQMGIKVTVGDGKRKIGGKTHLVLVTTS